MEQPIFIYSRAQSETHGRGGYERTYEAIMKTHVCEIQKPH